jgi:hypothetical protein
MQSNHEFWKGGVPSASHLHTCSHVCYGEHFPYDKASADKILCFLCLKTGQIQCQALL